MTHTVVGLFERQEDATKAHEALESAGFDRLAMEMHCNTGTSATTRTGAAHSEGGISGWFQRHFGLGQGDPDVALYSEAERRGGCILTVHVADESQVAGVEETLSAYGAVSPDERAETWRNEGWSDSTATTAGTAAAVAGTSRAGSETLQERATIPVVQEELRIGKRQVSRGGLRVFTRLVETPVEETVALREEHATIQRHAVDRPATEADLAALRDGVIEVRESSEEVVAQKVARVTEEIEVGKQVTERQETVHDTVRHTDVRVEQVDEHAMAREATLRDADRPDRNNR